MTAAHRQERERLDLGQQQRWEQENRERSERLNTGLRGLWDRFTGTHVRIQQQNVQEALEALRRDREQRDVMVQAQLLERRSLQSQLEASRSQQAALLRELCQDRKPYREAYKEAVRTPEPPRAPHAPEPNIQEAPKEQPAVPKPTQQPIEQPPQAADRLTEEFRENALPNPVSFQPSHEDRLQALRNGQINTDHDNGPERER